MPEIILTEEQAKVLRGATGPIVAKDQAGNLVGRIQPSPTPEFIAELKRRANAPGPRYSGKQIQSRLAALQQEWDRIGGFDEAAMREFLRNLDEADPGTMRPSREQR